MLQNLFIHRIRVVGNCFSGSIQITLINIFLRAFAFDSILVFLSQAPKRLQVEVLAGLFGEDVKRDVAEVHRDPVLALLAFDLGQNIAGVSLEFEALSDELRHARHMSVAVAGDDAEVVDVLELDGEFDDHQVDRVVFFQDINEVCDVENSFNTIWKDLIN